MKVRFLQPLQFFYITVSLLNSKTLSALLILFLSVVEFLVFNEEVFIFLCFFVFFTAVSAFAGSSIDQAFKDISSDLEKSFLLASKEAKISTSSLISRKVSALSTLARAFVFLKAFRNLALQKSLLFASDAFSRNLSICRLALGAFNSSNLRYNLFSHSVSHAFAIDSSHNLKTLWSQAPAITLSKSLFVGPKSKLRCRVVDRLLSLGVSSSLKVVLL